MTYVRAGTLGTRTGQRDALVTRRSDRLRELGCTAYDVGVADDEPDAVFVVEVWESSAAHRASLQQPDVVAAIADAGPLLDGRVGGSGST